jgi:putative transcriptional regulator
LTAKENKKTAKNVGKNISLSGKCLIAVPGISDIRFSHSVIFVCANAKDGSMGLIVNRPILPLKFEELLKHLDISLPEDIVNNTPDIIYGGPMESSRGFVLHSSDFSLASTVDIAGGISITSTLDILDMVAKGTGPQSCMVALGYVSWREGQLEDELKDNMWLICDGDRELVFGTPYSKKWQKAMERIGINPNMFSLTQGSS